MAAKDPTRRTEIARTAADARWANRSDTAAQRRRNFRAAQAEEYIRRLVAEAPPLTRDQRDRLALLLRGSA